MTRGLDRDRWAALSPYLDEVLDVPVAARATWLADLRARDTGVADQLESLLAEYDTIDERFLARAVAPRASLAGHTVGAYTLREPIGQGGMGSVWLAERSDGLYQGRVAVKVLNASLVGHAEERFRREGRILARLRHPNIAQLVDAGVSSTGQPYIVLEYVDGEHLDQYCDRRRLGLEARVRLFRDVLAAVAHAHANLIVHRDLKPSNVLVDRGGMVKLLDFGVAKLLTPDAGSPPTTVTLEGGSWITPAYAAPEQLTGGDITTATDVFALGVLFYQLLAGRHPAGPEATPQALLRAVLAEEPARLSAAVTTEPGQPTLDPSQATNRGTTPEGLRRALRGDLETIVAKALKKDPAERYASVVALADDIRRYLEHVPIGARPDTFSYRATRFVRRNRLPVALGAMLLAALASGLAGTLWQARAAARQRDLAIAQLDRAESTNELTAYLLGQAAPGGEPVPVRTILESGEAIATRRARQDPALAVALLVSIGDIYVVRDETDNAIRTLGRAYQVSRPLADGATRAEAACAWARAVSMRGDDTGALRLIGEGLAATTDDARFDAVAVSCLLARTSIGVIQRAPGLVAGSARQALARLDRRPGANPEFRASALQMLALGHRLAGETAQADATFAQAYEQLRLIGYDGSSDMAVLLGNWAANTSRTSPLGSLETLARAIAIMDGAPDSVPLSMSLNYALQLGRLARHAEARAVLERAEAAARRHGNQGGIALARMRLAQECLSLGDLGCAKRYLAGADPGVAASHMPGHWARGDLARIHGLVAAAEGHDAEARRLLLDAWAVHGLLPDKDVTCVETLVQLARVELRLGAPAAAESWARQALAISERLAGGSESSSWVGRSLVALAAARLGQGDPEGHALAARALAHVTPTLGAGHPDAAEARRLMAR